MPGALNNPGRQGAPLSCIAEAVPLQSGIFFLLPPPLTPDNVHSLQETGLSLSLPDLLAPSAQPDTEVPLSV